MTDYILVYQAIGLGLFESNAQFPKKSIDFALYNGNFNYLQLSKSI
ncbi:hypothetical protein KCTC52924_03713 [Arenibacter antarcticus]